MISDEKMSHIVHLMMNGLEREGLVTFSNKETAIREAHKISNLYLGNLKGAADAARQRILSQKKCSRRKKSSMGQSLSEIFGRGIAKTRGITVS